MLLHRCRRVNLHVPLVLTPATLRPHHGGPSERAPVGFVHIWGREYRFRAIRSRRRTYGSMRCRCTSPIAGFPGAQIGRRRDGPLIYRSSGKISCTPTARSTSLLSSLSLSFPFKSASSLMPAGPSSRRKCGSLFGKVADSFRAIHGHAST
ncbi:hypothetical protein BD779DRAFT_545314 [Infundibulicybe gibba]|nr:hypothetical protein BD779DRAFT_545314 [Infundibulicybe gibba]